VIGHLKPGVTPAQAIAGLNAIGADLERNYPKEAGQMRFTLEREGLGFKKILVLIFVSFTESHFGSMCVSRKKS